MYLRQTCNIEIAGKYRLRGLHAVEIKKSIHQIIQQAKLELPLSVLFRNNKMLERIKLIDKIKEGDSISIDLGYDGKNRREFTGFIKRINPKMPVEIEIEDELYLLRDVYYKKNFKKNSIKDVLQFLINGLADAKGLKLELYDKMPELTVKNFMINNANGIEVLQGLMDTYPVFKCFLTTINGKKTLYCGLAYGMINNRVKYELNRNTISVDDLNYNQTAQEKHRVKIVNFKTDGTKEEFSYGDKNASEVTFTFNSSLSHEELKLLADAQLQKKITGYRGALETFLIPNIEPCDIAVIEDKQYGRNGSGYVGTVVTTMGSGARRKPEIEISL